MKLNKLFNLAAPLVAAVALTACGGKGNSNPVINGIIGPNVSYVNGFVSVSIVFENVHLDGGATIPIPKYPNSSFQLGPDFQSGGTLLSLSVNASDFLGNKGQGLDPQRLPGGRPLPGVASGQLPSIAVEIPGLNNSVLYFGPEVIGVFYPFSKLDLAGSIVTYRFYNTENKPVGNISLVGSDQNAKNAGILLLMNPDLLGLKGIIGQQNAMKRFYQMGYR